MTTILTHLSTIIDKETTRLLTDMTEALGEAQGEGALPPVEIYCGGGVRGKPGDSWKRVEWRDRLIAEYKLTDNAAAGVQQAVMFNLKILRGEFSLYARRLVTLTRADLDEAIGAFLGKVEVHLRINSDAVTRVWGEEAGDHMLVMYRDGDDIRVYCRVKKANGIIFPADPLEEPAGHGDQADVFDHYSRWVHASTGRPYDEPGWHAYASARNSYMIAEEARLAKEHEVSDFQLFVSIRDHYDAIYYWSEEEGKPVAHSFINRQTGKVFLPETFLHPSRIEIANIHA